MPYCSACGREVQVDSTFCPHCGAQIKVAGSFAGRSENEFDRISRDSRTQEHWVKRVVAYIIDWVIVSVATGILGLITILAMGLATGAFFGSASFFLVPFGGLSFGLFGLSAVLFLLYFTLMEAIYQRTIGKMMMGLRVSTTDGSKVDLFKAFVRNISKIYWLLLLLDLVGGFFGRVQPGQRYLDHIANTIVISST